MSAYDAFKEAQAMLEQQVAATAKTLRAIPGVGTGPMGLTPDAVRVTQEYRTAKAAANAAFAALRTFNGKYVKKFRAEIEAERDKRRQGAQ